MGRLALGTVQWGMPYGIANRTGVPASAEIEEMLALAARAGVTVIDTARAYGTAEETIGRLTKGSDDWRVVTKVDPSVSAAESVSASMDALGRRPLETVLLHDATRQDQWRDLLELREAGAVLRAGISASTPDEAFAALENADVQVIQVAASLFDQRLERGGFFDLAVERGAEVFVRSVYLQGAAHFRPDALPPHLIPLGAPLRAVHTWARQHQLAPSEVFLLYAMALPGVTIVVGCESRPQLEANLRVLRHPRLSGDELSELSELTAGLPEEVLTPSRWPTQ